MMLGMTTSGLRQYQEIAETSNRKLQQASNCSSLKTATVALSEFVLNSHTTTNALPAYKHVLWTPHAENGTRDHKMPHAKLRDVIAGRLRISTLLLQESTPS